MCSPMTNQNDSTDAAINVGLGGVVVIVPALNEERSLPLVLRDLPSVGKVIVVDNGSTDATARVAADARACVVAEPCRGYGAACLSGLAQIDRFVALGEPSPSIVVFLDGDYSDYPEFLPDLVMPIMAGHADFVLGSRIRGRREPGAMPPQCLFGNWLACLLMRILFGARYTDLGPFRAIRYESLKRLEMMDRNFGWTVEMQIKAMRAGLRIEEVPVPYRRRIGQSKISGTILGSLRAGYKILYLIGKYGWQRQSQ